MVVAVSRKRSAAASSSLPLLSSSSSSSSLSCAETMTADLLERLRGRTSLDSQVSLLTATTAGTGDSSSSSSCKSDGKQVLPRTRQDLLNGREDSEHASLPKGQNKTDCKDTDYSSDIKKTGEVLPLFDICPNANIDASCSPTSTMKSIARIPSSLRPSRYGGTNISDTDRTSAKNYPSSSSSTYSASSSSSASASTSYSDDRICNLRRRIRHHQRRMSAVSACSSNSSRNDDCKDLCSNRTGRSGDGGDDDADDAKSHCSARSAPGRLRAARSTTLASTASLPLPLTTVPPTSSHKDAPYHKSSGSSILINFSYYALALVLVVFTILNKSHASNLSHHLTAARTHTISAQHHLTTATLELNNYDEYLHNLESIGTSLRSELTVLTENVVTKSRRLTVQDAQRMVEHESFVDQMKRRERTRRETMEGLKVRVQEAARAAVLDKYGRGMANGGRYHVELAVRLPSTTDDNDQPQTFTIETASLVQAPHTVHHFLEQIDANLWNDRKLAFTSNPGHLLRATPTSDDVVQEFGRRGLNRLIVDESPSATTAAASVSDDSSQDNNNNDKDGALQHKAYTVAFPSSHIGSSLTTNGEIGFYINTADNTDVHDADAIIGTVISGRDVVQRMLSIPANPSRGGIPIIGAKILS